MGLQEKLQSRSKMASVIMETLMIIPPYPNSITTRPDKPSLFEPVGFSKAYCCAISSGSMPSRCLRQGI